MTPGCDLSVVLACDGTVEKLPQRLDAIARGCSGLTAEVIVVHGVGTQVVLPSPAPMAATLVEAPTDLVPVLWGRGMSVARGRVVALTTTQFDVGPKWGATLVETLDRHALDGVGGRMAISPDASHLVRAVFLIRYSEHMGDSETTAPREIAGDNAAYRRDAVLAVLPTPEDGFWEVDVHRLLRARGGKIGRAPGAVAIFDPGFSFGAMVENRFVHGAHFGAYRVRELGWAPWRAIAVTPLVPGVLFGRILGRMRRAGQSVWSVIPLAPAIFMLLTAWAAGEARGAVAEGGRGPA